MTRAVGCSGQEDRIWWQELSSKSVSSYSMPNLSRRDVASCTLNILLYLSHSYSRPRGAKAFRSLARFVPTAVGASLSFFVDPNTN